MANFIQRTLEEGETVLFHGRLHWTYNWEYLLGGWALLIAAIAGIVFLWAVICSNLIFIGLWALVALAGLGLIGWAYFIRSKTEFAVTNTRFIQKDGIFSVKMTEIPLYKVETVNFYQTFGERILGTGVIELVGSGGTSHKLPYVQKPHEVRNILTTNMKSAKND